MQFTDILYRSAALFMRLICTINGGITVMGKEHIPARGGVIIALNHISYLDPPLVGAVLPRRATFMARRGLFSIPLLGMFVNCFAIPVDREKTRPSTIKETLRRLKDGNIIVIFPEGRRSDTGKLLSARQGIGLLACRGNVPVVPALISGSEKVLPPGARWLRRARVSIQFDRPIYVSSSDKKGGDNQRAYGEITEKVMSAIRELKKSVSAA